MLACIRLFDYTRMEIMKIKGGRPLMKAYTKMTKEELQKELVELKKEYDKAHGK